MSTTVRGPQAPHDLAGPARAAGELAPVEPNRMAELLDLRDDRIDAGDVLMRIGDEDALGRRQ
jgi:hypothetical protein